MRSSQQYLPSLISSLYFKLPQPPIADIIMETFARTAARPNPLGSSHVRILSDVASRWRLALDNHTISFCHSHSRQSFLSFNVSGLG